MDAMAVPGTRKSVYALEPPRVVRIAPRMSRGGRTLTLTIPPRVRRSGRLLAPFLVLSNGGVEAVGAYRVSAR